jgi:Ni2+-binding GTPase involved in maturation of urease and hydrogenase
VKLHIVGGFLGSGKTTSIAAAARALLARGQRVGIVTNDQGKYLVDTAFFRALRLPTVEVTGSCFCCNYDDLDARLAELEASARPDVIFAESVGSCADILATVVRPLLELSVRPSTYSVFADSRLLLQRLRGLPLPFSDDIIYVFDAQIEEAGLLVLNKADLLPADTRAELTGLAAEKWPAKVICVQNALAEDGVAGWLRLLDAGTPPGIPLPDLDYARYGAGEAELAWLDMRLTVALPDRNGAAFLRTMAEALVAAIDRAGIAIGHLKLVAESATEVVKVSLTAARDPAWLDSLPRLETPELTLVINLRAQAKADTLSALAEAVLNEAISGRGATLVAAHADHFHPGIPRPTHRLI